MARLDPRLWRLIQIYSRKYRLDPRAVAAVSLMEGGGRLHAVGDSGTSYGAFQLHWQGAMPRQYWGNPRASVRFAASPAGIDYALRQMAHSGAAGLRGPAAVSQIVRGFERPANPAAEIAGAINQYRTLRRLPALAGGAPGGGPRFGPVRQSFQYQPISVQPPALNLTSPITAANIGLPAIQATRVGPGYGSTLATTGASLTGQLESIRRRLLA